LVTVRLWAICAGALFAQATYAMTRRTMRFALALILCGSPALAQGAPDIELYLTPGEVQNVAPGPDGAMWFTMATCDNADPNCSTPVRHEWIGRITVAGDITTFPLPFDPMPLGRGVYGLTAGPDGALWFTEIRGNRIGRLTTSGAVTYFPLPAPHEQPYLITTGADGALWFTESHAIGRITTAGALTRYPVETAYSSDPTAITPGPDGALWFTEVNQQRIGRTSTAGQTTVVDLPGMPGLCGPLGITAGPDGALWFACLLAGRIGRMATDGTLSSYPVNAKSGPSYLAPGPDGALWFTEQNTNSIGRITPDGVVDEYPLLAGSGLPHGIAAGPGGVWFTDLREIGRIRFADTTPPRISGMPGTDCSLWPPNHQLRQVAHVSAADTDSGLARGSLTVTVTSSEPQLPGPSDSVVTADGAGGFFVQLRADRRGEGSGRVYTIVATARDLAGNTARATSTCVVPHDARP